MGAASGGEGNVNRSDQEGNDLGTDGPRHANGLPGDSDRWLRSVVEHFSEIVTIVDPDGTLRYASPAFERVLGYDSEEAIGTMNVLDHVHPADLPHVLEEAEEALAEGGITTIEAEYRFRHADGSWRWMESVGTYLLDDPEVEGVVVVSRDVTGRKRAEERYRTLVERVPAVVYLQEIGSPDSTMYMSPQIETLTGYTPEECKEPDLTWRMVHPEDREQMQTEDERTGEPGEVFASEYRVVHRDGRTVWVRNESVLVEDEVTGSRYWQGFMLDITERKRAEEKIRNAEERYRTLVEQIPAVTYIDPVDDPDTSLYTSPHIEEMLGYTPQEWQNEKLWPKRLHPEDRERVLAADERFEAGGRPFREEYRLLAKDGSVVWVREEAVLVRDEAGEPLYWQGVFYDITERKFLEERLEHRALHDSLTGLPNRQLFMDRLGQALRRTRRRKKGRVAVLFMDLDGFKVVNDSLGHEAGDLLLAAVAKRLKRCLRPEDTLARFGGDEFVVLVEDVEAADEAVRVAERIIDELRERFVLDGRELYARASIGIAIGEDRTKDPDDLLRDADTAMYRAKDEGWEYAVFDPVMYEKAIDRLEVENDLGRAVEQEEFVVHYQPIVSLQTGEVFAVEALVRWEHPERGLLDPDEFVPMSEESGLVIPMGEQVLREACLKAKEWQEAHPRTPPLVMSVNLSATQLVSPDLAETVEGILKETGLEGSCLTLDVTETVYVRALAGNTATLDRLRGLGARISIDDFGVGYSSLAYLKRLPADSLKIDRSFVKGLGENVEDTAIVHMIIELAHTLGLKVIAEGVEGKEQAELLREMGCDMAQGYHFSTPLPSQEIPALLSSYTPT
jgi:diguanylate cyclase (GGDEF)-like protein/PAS domain S-box-containing protein